MAPGLNPLAVRTSLDVFCNVDVHPGPPDVAPDKLDWLLASEVSCHIAVVFGFENGRYHEFWNVEASSVVENVVTFHCLMLGWFHIITAI